MPVITIERKVLQKNDDIAQDNRHFFQYNRIFTVNLVSSPGSGKTTLLEKTLQQLAHRLSIAVIEGDVQTDRDAQRIARHRVPVVQIVTQGGCHLDAGLVRDAVQKMALKDVQVLFIENVGNLVCPANYDLGEDLKAIIMSTTEGDDKPLKYPHMFRASRICIINKVDLLPYVDFSIQNLTQNALQVNPALVFIELSAKTGQGIEGWIDWVLREYTSRYPGAA